MKERNKSNTLYEYEELNEKLHGRDVHLDRARQHTPYDPGQGGSDPNARSQFQETEGWRDPIVKNTSSAQEIVFSDISTRRRRRRIALVLGGIAALMLLGGLAFKIRAMLFSEERVKVTITGPKNVASDEETTFTVMYANNNWAGLDNVTLVLSYPESFHPEAGSAHRAGSLTEVSSDKSKPIRTGKY
jgi:hypothetical protein